MLLIPKILVEDIFLTKIQQLNWSSTLDDLLEKIDSLPTSDPIATIDEMIVSMLSKAEEHKENKRLDLARNTLDIVYAFRELKSRLLLTQK